MVVAVIAAFLAYLVAGHAHHPGKTMEEAAMGAGICIVLVTGVGAVVLLRPATLGRPSASLRALALAEASVLVVPQPGARGSPEWLQRFLN